ncbi:MAG TPA: amino acid--tRNA ligase-related protein, partial [Spirochaetia bacterium]|nr:amino acid--tRNA ligase-related protein [Spirochaetia bacterium]
MSDPLRHRLQRHALFRRSIREFFAERGYVEVDTPSLAPFLIPEPAIDVFATRLHRRRGSETDLWLAPSPELWMKRLLGAGSGNIFQLARAFRNGDLDSPIHNPEFTLLEWYTMDSGYEEAIGITEDLFRHLLDRGVGGPRAERLRPPFHLLRMSEAFQ